MEDELDIEVVKRYARILESKHKGPVTWSYVPGNNTFEFFSNETKLIDTVELKHLQ